MKKQWTLKLSRGFTLIEIIITIIIVSILATVAVFKYMNMSSSTSDTVQKQVLSAVKSAFAVAVVDLKRYPTADELTQHVQGTSVFISPFGGLETTINNQPYWIFTYSDAACTALSPIDPFETVRCVGTISSTPPELGEAEPLP